MKNLENEKVLWQPVLGRYLRACYHSAVTNRKRPALKISVTDDSITTVSLYLSFNGTGCYRLVLCCRCCTARTSLTWKWLFLCREVNFWFTSYIFCSCLGVLPQHKVCIQISFWELSPLASLGQQNHLFSFMRWPSSVETLVNGFRINMK